MLYETDFPMERFTVFYAHVRYFYSRNPHLNLKALESNKNYVHNHEYNMYMP